MGQRNGKANISRNMAAARSPNVNCAFGASITGTQHDGGGVPGVPRWYLESTRERTYRLLRDEGCWGTKKGCWGQAILNSSENTPTS